MIDWTDTPSLPVIDFANTCICKRETMQYISRCPRLTDSRAQRSSGYDDRSRRLTRFLNNNNIIPTSQCHDTAHNIVQQLCDERSVIHNQQENPGSYYHRKGSTCRTPTRTLKADAGSPTFELESNLPRTTCPSSPATCPTP